MRVGGHLLSLSARAQFQVLRHEHTEQGSNVIAALRLDPVEHAIGIRAVTIQSRPIRGHENPLFKVSEKWLAEFVSDDSAQARLVTSIKRGFQVVTQSDVVVLLSSLMQPNPWTFENMWTSCQPLLP